MLNWKVVIIIKTLHFEDYGEFACIVSGAYDRVKLDDKYTSVNVIAKYEDAKEIICKLVEMGYGISFITDFADPGFDGYDDAFVISLLDDEIWCEPVKREKGYIFVEAEVVYIFDDCNSKIIPKIESDEVYEVEMSDEYDDCDNDECNCCNCHEYTCCNENKVVLDRDDDGNIHGFTSFKGNDYGYAKHELYCSTPLKMEMVNFLLESIL